MFLTALGDVTLSQILIAQIAALSLVFIAGLLYDLMKQAVNEVDD